MVELNTEHTFVFNFFYIFCKIYYYFSFAFDFAVGERCVPSSLAIRFTINLRRKTEERKETKPLLSWCGLIVKKKIDVSRAR